MSDEEDSEYSLRQQHENAFFAEFSKLIPLTMKDSESFSKWVGEYADSRDELNHLYELENRRVRQSGDLTTQVLNLETMVSNLLSWVHLHALMIDALNRRVNEVDGAKLSQEEREVVALILQKWKEELARVKAGRHIDYEGTNIAHHPSWDSRSNHP